MANPTKEELQKAFDVLTAVASAIHDLGEVPSGHLYARLMGTVSLEGYNKLIGTLKGAKLVSESNNVLKWIGPKKA